MIRYFCDRCDIEVKSTKELFRNEAVINDNMKTRVFMELCKDCDKQLNSWCIKFLKNK